MGGGCDERSACGSHLCRRSNFGRIRPMSSARMRSPLSRALGLGSARDGVETWWRERVSAVALVPLTAWLTVSILMRADKGYAAVVAWLKLPVTTTLMTLLLIALFY